MTVESPTHAMIRTAAPLAARISMSIPNTRFRRRAHIVAARRAQAEDGTLRYHGVSELVELLSFVPGCQMPWKDYAIG
ncbi:MAG: hypothetical protein AB7Q97_15780 [Gammaproteobacteria bacterium]